MDTHCLLVASSIITSVMLVPFLLLGFGVVMPLLGQTVTLAAVDSCATCAVQKNCTNPAGHACSLPRA